MLCLINNFIATRKAESYHFFPLMMVAVLASVGALLQAVFFWISLIYVSLALSLVVIYFDLQNENSYIDALSRVYNRQYLNIYIDSAIRQELDKDGFLSFGRPRDYKAGRMACLLIDMDRFKEINDNYGHLEGDNAIRDMGRILLKNAPKGAMCARYGGDEFVMCVYVDDDSELQTICDNIRGACERLNNSGHNVYRIDISIGTARFDPATDNLESFLRRLDTTMYKEKKRRHANYDRRKS
jgi:diguanylate cyclase (GGDEF)-like protein